MATTINLTVKSDFAAASADLKKFGAVTEAQQKKIEEFVNSFKDESIKSFNDRLTRTVAAVKATDGPIAALRKEKSLLRTEIQKLIRNGLDPESDQIKELTSRYQKLEKEIIDTNNAKQKSQKTSALTVASFTFIAQSAINAGKQVFAFAKSLEDAAAVQEQAEAILRQTIKATGSAAGLTAKELTDMATALQGVTKFGDEAIIGAESLLLTFKDVGEDVFPRALESILNVSEAMGQDLKSSTIQLGKALNDPIGGIAALTRVGIQFTDEQKNLIKSFAEAGETAKAQDIILKELESQFGGVARAAADTASGIGVQLNNSFGDLKETVGLATSEGLAPFRQSLLDEVQAVNATIKAHFLRNKVTQGQATIVEELTLRELEQAKAEKELAQAKLNVTNATSDNFDISKLDAVQQERILKARDAALKKAEMTITALEDEVTLRKLSTQAARDQFQAEQDALDVKLASFQSAEDALKKEQEERTLAEQKAAEAAEAELARIEAEQNARAESAAERFLLEEQVEQAIIDRDQRIKESAEERARIEEELSKAAADKIIADQKAIKEAYIDIAKNGLGAMAQGFAEVGKAIVDGSLGWKTFAKLGLQALSSVLNALGAQMAAQAAIAFFGFPPRPASGFGLLAGSSAAFTASGVVSAAAGSFEQGGFIPGTSFSGDNMSANVNSGEVVLNPAQQNKFMDVVNGLSNSGGGGSFPSQLTLVIDGQPFIARVQQGINNRELRGSRGGAI